METKIEAEASQGVGGGCHRSTVNSLIIALRLPPQTLKKQRKVAKMEEKKLSLCPKVLHDDAKCIH